MRDRTFSRREMLWTGGALAVGAAFAEPLAAAAEPTEAGPEPTSWVDPVMPEMTHRMIGTNGIRLHVAQQGEGPLVILCHGFPECWYSWRHQLPALAKAGFRAVAPDLRGYGRSDRPEEMEKYTILHDVGDLVGLLDALGVKQAVIAGHDIGATIAWQAALLRPDRFKGVIALGVPFRPRAFGGLVPPTTLMPQNENAVFYQLYFQSPEAEGALGRDIRRTFRSQFYALSGDKPPAGGGGFAAGMVPRKGALLADPESLPAWVTESDIDRSWELMAPFAGAAVAVPALFMAGDRDVIVAVFHQFIGEQSTLVPKLRPTIILPGCGHWTQQERAPQVSAAMIDFLRSL